MKYTASIFDKKLPHCSFEFGGYHHIQADSLEKLLNKIKNLNVMKYSTENFLALIKKRDENNTTCDINNMMNYTSF